MSKKAVIYYSHSNNTKKVVNEIENELDVDVYEIIPEKEILKDKGLLREKIKNLNEDCYIDLCDLNIDLDSYDTLIIGSPVWESKISIPVASFLKKHNLENKVIVPFVTCEEEVGNALDDFKRYLSNCEVTNEMDIKFNDGEIDTNMVGILGWINSI